MEVSKMFNIMSYFSCKDSRAWNPSNERQARYLLDVVKYQHDNLKCVIDLKEAMTALPHGACECKRRKKQAGGALSDKENQCDSEGMCGKRRKRSKGRHNQIKRKTAELTEEDARKIFNNQSKDQLNYQKVEAKRLHFDTDKPKLSPGQARMHLPAAGGLTYKNSEERLQETIDEIGMLVNNTINAMIAVLNAYVGTAEDLYDKHQILRRKRVLLERKIMLPPTYSFDHRDHADALSYIDFAIDDILKRLWVLHEMMDTSDLPQAADQLFDLVEYFMEVEKVYSVVIPRPKDEDSIDECDENGDLNHSKSQIPIQGRGQLCRDDSHSCSAEQASVEDIFSSKGAEQFKHYKFVGDKPRPCEKENIAPNINIFPWKDKGDQTDQVASENMNCPVGRNKTVQVNMNHCRESLNEIMGVLTKLLCELAAKPLAIDVPDFSHLEQTANRINYRRVLKEKLAQISTLNNEILNECQHIDKFVKSLFDDSNGNSKNNGRNFKNKISAYMCQKDTNRCCKKQRKRNYHRNGT